MSAFLRDTGHESYADAYAWSVLHPQEFWPAVWRFADMLGRAGKRSRAWTRADGTA